MCTSGFRFPIQHVLSTQRNGFLLPHPTEKEEAEEAEEAEAEEEEKEEEGETGRGRTEGNTRGVHSSVSALSTFFLFIHSTFPILRLFVKTYSLHSLQIQSINSYPAELAAIQSIRRPWSTHPSTAKSWMSSELGGIGIPKDPEASQKIPRHPKSIPSAFTNPKQTLRASKGIPKTSQRIPSAFKNPKQRSGASQKIPNDPKRS